MPKKSKSANPSKYTLHVKKQLRDLAGIGKSGISGWRRLKANRAPNSKASLYATSEAAYDELHSRHGTAVQAKAKTAVKLAKMASKSTQTYMVKNGQLELDGELIKGADITKQLMQLFDSMIGQYVRLRVFMASTGVTFWEGQITPNFFEYAEKSHLFRQNSDSFFGDSDEDGLDVERGIAKTPNKITRQAFKDGDDGLCLMGAIRDWTREKAESAVKRAGKKPTASQRDAITRAGRKLTEAMEDCMKYRDGVPEDDISDLCNKYNINIKILTPLSIVGEELECPIVEHKCAAMRSAKNFTFVNTRLNHVEQSHSIVDCSKTLTEVSDRQVLEYEASVPGAIWWEGRDGKSKVVNQNGTFVMDDQYRDLVNVWEEQQGLNSANTFVYENLGGANGPADTDLYTFSMNACKYLGTCDFVDPEDELIKQAERLMKQAERAERRAEREAKAAKRAARVAEAEAFEKLMYGKVTPGELVFSDDEESESESESDSESDFDDLGGADGPADDLPAGVHHIDMTKAYANTHLCPTYKGYAAVLTDYATTDRIVGVGMYYVDRFDFKKAPKKLKEIRTKLRLWRNGEIWCSTELEMLATYGVTFTITHGAWCVKTHSLDFMGPIVDEAGKPAFKDKEGNALSMLSKTNGVPNYSRWTGQQAMENKDKTIFMRTSDHEHAHAVCRALDEEDTRTTIFDTAPPFRECLCEGCTHLTRRPICHKCAATVPASELPKIDNEVLAERYKDKTCVSVRYPKQNHRNRSHIMAQTLSYSRQNMVHQLMNMDLSKIIRVVADGVYTREKVEDMVPIFSKKPYDPAKLINQPMNPGCNVCYVSNKCDRMYMPPSQPSRFGTEQDVWCHGPGGTGKTHSIINDPTLVRTTYAAHSWKLSREKQQEAGVRSTVHYRLLVDEEDLNREAGGSGGNLLFDECSMLTDDARLHAEAAYPYVRRFWVGDECQMPPCTKGPKLNTSKMMDVPFTKQHRCQCPRLAEFLESLRCKIKKGYHGKPALQDSIERYKGMYGTMMTREEVVEEYTPEDMILAYTHQQKGEDVDEEGELVQTKSDVEELFPVTGDKWHVTKTSRFASNGDIVLGGERPRSSTRRHVYTVHVVQGQTFDKRIYIDLYKFDVEIGLKLLYTACSRARKMSQLRLILS